jgi:hypothetical protein
MAKEKNCESPDGQSTEGGHPPLKFLLLAHGSETFCRQGLLSALSIRARLPAANVVVYTDRPDFFQNRGLTVRSLSRLEMASLYGPLHYYHRVKIGILLREALSALPEEPILYVDSDTYYRGTSDPDPFRGRPFLMHYLEGPVTQPRFSRLNDQLLGALRGAARPASALRVPMPDFKTMYNSGLVGFARGGSLETVRFLHEALSLTDWLCAHFPGQMPLLEQIALSWVAENTYEVAADTAGFEHYFNWNTEVATLLSEKSDEELAHLAADAALFDQLTAEARKLRENAWYRATSLTPKRWRRSRQKRLMKRLARKLQA